MTEIKRIDHVFMTEEKLNQIKDLPINNINNITQLILFLVKGKIYTPYEFEEKVLSLHTTELDLGISLFRYNIKYFHIPILEKLKEAIFLTKRIYKIFVKFPLGFANGINKDVFFHITRYLIKLSVEIQNYISDKGYEKGKVKPIMTTNQLFEEMEIYEGIEEYDQNLTEIIINLLLNSVKLNPNKDDKIKVPLL